MEASKQRRDPGDSLEFGASKDHDSHDKTVASLLAQLHDERIEKVTQLLNQLLAKVKGD